VRQSKQGSNNRNPRGFDNETKTNSWQSHATQLAYLIILFYFIWWLLNLINYIGSRCVVLNSCHATTIVRPLCTVMQDPDENFLRSTSLSNNQGRSIHQILLQLGFKNFFQGGTAQQGNIEAAIARTASRSLALYFARPVRLFRPAKGAHVCSLLQLLMP